MRIFATALLILLLPATLLAAGGVKGRIAWRGVLVPGITVRAYASIDDIAAHKPLAVSAPSAQDGTYKLELSAGHYYLTARSSAGKPAPGDYFCYYSGAPVIVAQKGYRQVGFNLIKVPQEKSPHSAKRSGLSGEISFQGEPLEKTYLYVYKKTDSNFKGPAWFIQPVARGKFRMSLPPGDYWLLARKRQKGGQYGPIEIGDYFNYYYGNPVHLEANQVKDIQLETITRLSMLEEDPDAVFSGVTGSVVGADGKPAAGLRVFAYRSETMTGTPAYISPATDPAGHFRLAIPETGTYWLLARQVFGGPATSGELYGRLHNGAGGAIAIKPEQLSTEVQIDVAPHP